MTRLKSFFTAICLLATVCTLGLIFLEAIQPASADPTRSENNKTTQLYATVPPTSTPAPIPTIPHTIHEVVSGDSLYYIAIQYNIDTNTIIEANSHLTFNSILDVGDQLMIPLIGSE